MKTESLSGTYTYLYKYIIQDLLSQICNQNSKYCVRRKIGNDDFPIALEKNMKNTKEKPGKICSAKDLTGTNWLHAYAEQLLR